MKKLETYACYYLEDETRLRSSSGAVFSALANYFFSKNGIVYGVAMSEDCYSAEFVSETCIEELSKLCGSKYLQAKVGNTFKKVELDLQEGKMVLFTGTGCQINGLKNFLRREYDKLYCVDVVCHGVPSPLLWKNYVINQEKRNEAKVVNVNFRCKDNNGESYGIKENQSYISKDIDSYTQMFLRDYCLRPACYECIVKSMKMSDITIGDFWGIENIAPEMNDGKGISLVIVRTNKGKELFEIVKNQFNVRMVSYDDGVKSNPAEYKSVLRPTQRENFFLDMKSMDFQSLEEKYASPMMVSIKTKVKRRIKSILRIMLRGERNKKRDCSNYGVLLTFEKKEILKEDKNV